jgi:hypothetical protein
MSTCSHICATLFILLAGFVCDLSGTIVKKDLRSSPDTKIQIVVLCALQQGSNGVFAATAHGDLTSGFAWDRLFRIGESRPINNSETKAGIIQLDNCIHASVGGDDVLFVAEVGSKVYVEINELLCQRSEQRGDTNKNIEMVDLLSAIVKAANLTAPTDDTTAFAYLSSIATANPGSPQDGVQWIWAPPVLKLSAPTPANGSTQADSASYPEDELIPVTLAGIQSIDRRALLRFYQALADAEDQPSVSYDIELHIEDESLTSVQVHPVELKREAGFERGDAVCIYTNPDVSFGDPIELLNTLAALSFQQFDHTSDEWGFAASHPMLGTPRNWQAAVTSPPACLFSTASGAAVVGLASPTYGMQYIGTLIRGIPRYPTSAGVFNSHAPLYLKRAKTDPYVGSEQAWDNYRSLIDQVISIAEVRATSYAGLPTIEIKKRKSYAEAAEAEDELNWAIRRYFAFHELGWQQYQSNKYRGQQEDQVQRYNEGVNTLYGIAAKNNAFVESVDLTAALQAQSTKYQKLMTTSVFAKPLVTPIFDPTLSDWGVVCVNSELLCNSMWAQLSPPAETPIRLTVGGSSQAKFANLLDLGQFSLAAPVTLASEFGGNPDGSNCSEVGDPQNPGHVGGLEITVQITNVSQNHLHLGLAPVGSWIRVSWNATPRTFVVDLDPGKTGEFTISFQPKDDFEDLNDIFVLQDGRPIAELTIDYSFINEKPVQIVEIDSGQVESALNSDSATYQIGIGKPPQSFAFRKSCVWLSGDRFACERHSHCEWSNKDDTAVIARFDLQGHNEGGGRRLSTGHLRIAYEMTSIPIKLH